MTSRSGLVSKGWYVIGRCMLALAVATAANAQPLFSDDFQNGLQRWLLKGAESIRIVDSKENYYQNVLELQSNGPVYALIKDSEKWKNVRIEGDFYFPDHGDSYFGLIYHYTESKERFDFSSIYVKNDSYVQVNPWRDGNASRLLYDEFTTYLVGADTVMEKKWYHFKAEIIGNTCHYYVNDMTKPKIVFPYYEGVSGMLGFKPRVSGLRVWVDNVSVASISNFSYHANPSVIYRPEKLVTNWLVIGPLPSPVLEIEKAQTVVKSFHTKYGTLQWQPIQTDGRGAVVTGRITQYYGDKPVAYFKTIIESDQERDITLHFSSVDELALYVNGLFYGYVYRQGYVSGPGRLWNAWYDFWENPKHAGRRVIVSLKKGPNQIVVRSRNGDFASGGFFLRIE